MNHNVLTRLYYYMIIILSGALLTQCGGKNGAKPPREEVRFVKAIQISNVSSFNGRSFPGQAKASQEVNLAFNVNGTLVKLPIKIGDKVKKGDLLAKLDPREFEAKVKLAKAEFTRDEQNYLRAKELVGKGHISKSDYDILEAKWTTSQANLDLAQKALIDSVIKAPFNGEISNLFVENYQTIASQQVIARLLDISQIEMIIQVPENAISFIPKAKDITVQFDSFPDHLIPAQIKEISNEASLETRTYPVTLIMQQPKDIQILPGMAGKAKGKVQDYYSSMEINKVVVPASALLTIDTSNKTYIWVINTKTNQVHKHHVKIGELTPTGISVSDGLKSGDWVVTAGVHFLKEGEVVNILNQ